MFGIFKKKTELEKLESKYNKLLIEWHKLSSVNRAKSDMKYAEAQLVLDKIESYKKNK